MEMRSPCTENTSHDRQDITLILNNSNIRLTFRGLCTVIYSYNKSQRDELFLKFIKKNLRNSASRWLSL